jgi:hypothetical protein
MRYPNRAASAPSKSTQRSQPTSASNSLADTTGGGGTTPLPPETTEAEIDRIKFEKFTNLLESSQGRIVFFGKVVDELGQPLPGVNVIVTRSYFDPLKLEGEEAFIGKHRSTLTTDISGGFKIGGLRGYGLIIDLDKSSYIASPRNTRGFNSELPRTGV